MKKKYRDIIVNGKKYHWAVGKPNCDGDYNNCLTIWFMGKQIYSNVIDGTKIVTPKFISEFIEKTFQTL